MMTDEEQMKREREAQARIKAEEERTRQEIERDRAAGYLIGAEANEWQQKQNALIDSFLDSMFENVYEAMSGAVTKQRKYKTARAWAEEKREEFKSLKQAIEFPAKLIKGGKLNTDVFAALTDKPGSAYRVPSESGVYTFVQPKKVTPAIVPANDPPFTIPKGGAVYEYKEEAGTIVFYALLGSSLHIVTKGGEVLKANPGYEGEKAKAARLAAEEAERKRKAEIERMQREEAAENARQESQLSLLKALPADKFKKLMALING